MKTPLTWTLITFAVMLLLWLILPTETPKVNNHTLHYPDGLTTEQVQIIEDSLWYPSMKPVNDSAWVWITDAPIVKKPE